MCATPGTIATDGNCNNILGDPPECKKGNICLNVVIPGGSNKQCTQFCNRDGGAPSCLSGSCTAASGVDFGVCYGPDPLLPCQLFGAACADSTKSCLPTIGGTSAITVCTTAGSIAVGGACNTILGAPSECVPGSACFNVSGAGLKCVQLCNGDAGVPTCTGGTTCNPATGTSFGTCL